MISCVLCVLLKVRFMIGDVIVISLCKQIALITIETDAVFKSK